MTEPMRVKVKSGDGQTDLGLGYMVGGVELYFFRLPNGNLMSDKYAEEKPSANLIRAMENDFGATLVEKQSNPKIELDSGRIIYGCQCYWSRVEDD